MASSAISPTPSTRDRLKRFCLKPKNRVQWLVYGCAQLQLSVILNSTTPSPDMDQDSPSPQDGRVIRP